MKNIKIALLIMAFVLLLGAALPKVVKAQTGTVSTTVTIGTVSVTLTPNSVAYGNLPLSTPKESFDVLTSNNIQAQVGGVITDLDIKGAATTGWTIGTASGENIYVHAFGTAANVSTRPASYAPLTTSDAVLATAVPATNSIYFGLKITTPSSDSSGVQQTAVVTVTATFGG